MRLTILHTNDIHGRQERIAQIATLVRAEKEQADHPVLYLDAGDVEESTNPLSNVTKGAAMHRLLSLTTCDAATVGNACWLRYGPGVLEEHARFSSYPQLLANLAPVVGPVPSVMLGEVGVFGLTDPFRGMFSGTDWGFEPLDEIEVAKSLSRELREEGATFVILLSHLGLSTPRARWDDRRIAVELQDDVDLIIGAHSHDLLPEGELIGRVLVVQAGSFGDHIGRVEVDGAELRATVAAVDDDVPLYPAVAEEASQIEAEVSELLAEVIGHVDAAIDAEWIAETLRLRMGADAGVFGEGLTVGVVPAGAVTRGALWEASETGANPGVTSMTGTQLRAVVERGNDRAFMAETPGPLRGRQRGRLVLTGIDLEAIEPERTYVVAGSDWELDSYGGYTDEAWDLSIRYDFPVIIREAIEDRLAGSPAAGD